MIGSVGNKSVGVGEGAELGAMNMTIELPSPASSQATTTSTHIPIHRSFCVSNISTFPHLDRQRTVLRAIFPNHSPL